MIEIDSCACPFYPQSRGGGGGCRNENGNDCPAWFSGDVAEKSGQKLKVGSWHLYLEN